MRCDVTCASVSSDGREQNWYELTINVGMQAGFFFLKIWMWSKESGERKKLWNINQKGMVNKSEDGVLIWY